MGNIPLRIREIINHDPKNDFDFVNFSNEAERWETLNKIADIVIKYGIDKLNEMAKEILAKGKCFESTARMYKKLYDETGILTHHVMYKHDVNNLAEDFRKLTCQVKEMLPAG